jgi:serine/tyrosine/threonine adenylyltransferase
LKFSDIDWKSRLVTVLPQDPETRNFSRKVAHAVHSHTLPTAVSNPRLLGWSQALGDKLGIAKPNSNDSLSLNQLSGNALHPKMKPHSLRYGGHQFGHWAGQLGDGRAISLGEFETTEMGWQEYQMKGAGPTPYSRRADGRAVLRSSVREFLCSEAMHGLGVPTTRALCLVGTGDEVLRDMFYDGNAKNEPGAIVGRVAPSFLRFGNFEILAADQEFDLLKLLLQFLVQNFIPELDAADPDLPLQYLKWISERTARLVAQWMSFGFVHGVMNTDNMSALGLTIDYGPYGWLEDFDFNFTPNTTDAQGRRYCYGRQFEMAQWNLIRLAEALLPLVHGQNAEASAIKILEDCAQLYETDFQMMFSKKCGLTESQNSSQILSEMFSHLSNTQLDFTLFFRGLGSFRSSSDLMLTSETKQSWEVWIQSLTGQKLSEFEIKGWQSWVASVWGEWKSAGGTSEVSLALMNASNPAFVLRNYISHLAIQNVPDSLEDLLSAAADPFVENKFTLPWMKRKPAWAENMPGCSALSCSS